MIWPRTASRPWSPGLRSVVARREDVVRRASSMAQGQRGDYFLEEFIDGVTISILPTIGSDTIQLDVNAKVASHVGYTPNQNVPIISESTSTPTTTAKSR